MRATARAQPNIALIKYWGKRDVERNLPAVGSLSVTLDSLWTEMTVEFSESIERDSLVINGEPATDWLPRVTACLDHVAGSGRPCARVVSECNFPMAAGLASSASAFAALVVAADAAAQRESDRLSLARAAGRASGSAARSLYGGFVELSLVEENIELTAVAEESHWPLAVVVAVTSDRRKSVSSTAAMLRSADTSPFYARWVADQPSDLDTARTAIAAKDFDGLAGISEHNCLKMHSVIWTSRPAVTYWNPATLACLELVRELRANGVPVFFTMDAGPQVKAVCPPESAATVEKALSTVPGVERVMTSGLGAGARVSP